MALFENAQPENSATPKNGAGAAPPARPHGEPPELRDSYALAREVTVANSIADALRIDAASLAGNGGEGAHDADRFDLHLEHSFQTSRVSRMRRNLRHM